MAMKNMKPAVTFTGAPARLSLTLLTSSVSTLAAKVYSDSENAAT